MSYNLYRAVRVAQDRLRCASDQQSADCASSVRTDQYQISGPLVRHARQSMPGILEHYLSLRVPACFFKLFGLFLQRFERAFVRLFEEQRRMGEEERIERRHRQEFRFL